MAIGEMKKLLENDDLEGIEAAARQSVPRVLRFLIGRLYGGDEERFRAVRAIGHLVSDHELVDEARVTELLARFAWLLSDESGNVPFGVPEAMGEVIAQRPEHQRYLMILSSMLTTDEMSQTGDIERGVMWAVGRQGPVAAKVPNLVGALERAAREHDDVETRRVAAEALAKIQGD